MLYTNKKKTYPGRWIVKLVEAGLVVAIAFFALDTITNLMRPDTPEAYVITREIVTESSYTYSEPVFEAGDYFDMALIHQNSGEYYEAILDYNRALINDPMMFTALLNRGVAYEQNDNHYRAMFDFNAYLDRPNAVIVQYGTSLGEMPVLVDMSEGMVHEFTFTARAGQTIDISAASVIDGEVDPLLVVVDNNRSPIGAADDVLRQDGSYISMNSHIRNLNITRSGQYTVRLSHAGGGSYGTVELSLNVRGN